MPEINYGMRLAAHKRGNIYESVDVFLDKFKGSNPNHITIFNGLYSGVDTGLMDIDEDITCRESVVYLLNGLNPLILFAINYGYDVILRVYLRSYGDYEFAKMYGSMYSVDQVRLCAILNKFSPCTLDIDSDGNPSITLLIDRQSSWIRLSALLLYIRIFRQLGENWSEETSLLEYADKLRTGSATAIDLYSSVFAVVSLYLTMKIDYGITLSYYGHGIDGPVSAICYDIYPASAFNNLTSEVLSTYHKLFEEVASNSQTFKLILEKENN